MNFYLKFKETLTSVLPVMFIVVILGSTVAKLSGSVLFRFLAGGVFVIIGLTLFLLGVDIGILPMGERSGAALTAKKNLPLLLITSFFIGFIVTVAEPDVQVLANQVKGIDSSVNKWALVAMIACGVGFFVALGVLRTVMSLPLNVVLSVSYVIVFLVAFAIPAKFQGVAFDSGGATTGPMTVPFIMSLGMGVAAVRGSSGKAQDDSFGLTGIASIGPIAAVCVYGIILSGKAGNIINSPAVTVDNIENVSYGLSVFFKMLPDVTGEVLSALAPLAFMAFVFQLFLIKLPPFQVMRMIAGFILCFIGLVLFLTGAQGGFMSAGQNLGAVLGYNACSSVTGSLILILTALVFGAVVVCAEPAVWVLTQQVEAVSGGTIKRKIMLLALSSGVSVSVALSMLRVLLGFSLWYILIPGYLIALTLTFVSPKLFTGIAFDSGGVASGPMTSTFILSFALGASSAVGGNPATDAFGVIALVAMTPLIAIQILGIIYSVSKEREQ